MSDAAAGWMGRSVRRLEDTTLLRGRGRFVDDIELPGVRAVLTYQDLRPLLTCDRIPLALPVAAIRFHVDPCYLAERELTYVGEPIALVVADSRALAEDAANAVVLDYEPLPAVVDPRAGLERGAPQALLDCPDNLGANWTVKYGYIESAFASAAHRIAERFRIHKGGGHSIETRGVVARFDALEDLLTLWDSTQMPHKT